MIDVDLVTRTNEAEAGVRSFDVDFKTRRLNVDFGVQRFDVEFKPLRFDVELQTIELIGIPKIVRQFECGEDINDWQAVYEMDEKIYVAKSTGEGVKSVLGVAMQSGRTGEMIEVLLQGVRNNQHSYSGLQFLDSEGYLSANAPSTGYIVTIAFAYTNEVIIFDKKSCIKIGD